MDQLDTLNLVVYNITNDAVNSIFKKHQSLPSQQTVGARYVEQQSNGSNKAGAGGRRSEKITAVISKNRTFQR